jgi:hypothetical protein
MPNERVNTATYAEITITSWKQFLTVVQFLERGHEGTSGRWLYRGHSDSEWTLQTSFERRVAAQQKKRRVLHAMNLSKHESDSRSRKFAEATFFHLERDKHDELFLRVQETLSVSRFRSAAGVDGSFNNRIEALAAIQHFGGVTRLLDVTTAAFVALYFAFAEDHYACDDDDNERLQPKAIFAFREDALYGAQPEAQEPYQKRADAGDDAEHVAEDFDEEYLRHPDRNRHCLHWAEESMDIEEARIVGADSMQSGVIPIQLLQSNERMVAQQGLFLFPRLLSVPFEQQLAGTLRLGDALQAERLPEMDTPSILKMLRRVDLVKMVFDPKGCASADAILRSANVTGASLFPGIVGQAIAGSMT